MKHPSIVNLFRRRLDAVEESAYAAVAHRATWAERVSVCETTVRAAEVKNSSKRHHPQYLRAGCLRAQQIGPVECFARNPAG
jgi:hypothetical protein